ncbi:MAG: S8 family serine peptidase [bacterium]|nr:S8 family serine peptidase [bacterium]
MNRGNFLVHLMVAVILIALAAVVGQIGRWRTMLKVQDTTPRKVNTVPSVKVVEGDGKPELLVKFKPNVGRAQMDRIAASLNDRIDDSYEAINGLTAVDDLDYADISEVLRQYQAMSDVVEYAEPNSEIALDDSVDRNSRPEALSPNPVGAPNDPLFADQWALNNTGQNGGKANAHIDALKAWAKTQGSAEVVVAVLDTGVDYTHKDLAENMWIRPANLPQYVDADLGTVNDMHGFDANVNAADPMDDNGHGTHVAGIIGAEGNNGEGISGINWNVKIMPLKFLGRGGFGSVNDAIESINYAIDRKKNGVNLRVINASWGSTQRSKALEDAIRAAGEAGILFVAAAGNSSTDNDRRAHYPSNYDLPNMLSVAALDRSDALASFSNYGAKTVHVAAPGREITSTWLGDQYREASGTSMAAPQVSGIAALILANEPKLSMPKLRERIMKSSDPIDSLLGKVVVGGRLNAAKALGD